MRAPASRVRVLNEAPVAADGRYVVYWMVAARRPRSNFGLEHAVAHARELKVPLLIVEALRIGYRWASDRFHRFVLEGMAANHAYFHGTSAHYHPYLEPEAGAGKGLLAALAQHACVIVTDDYPAFFLPHMQKAAAAKVAVRLEAVDSNGLVPISAAAGRPFQNAYSFRRFLQHKLPSELARLPAEEPLAGVDLPRLTALPPELTQRWPALRAQDFGDLQGVVGALAIDHGVAKVASLEGGFVRAQAVTHEFMARRLSRYAGEHSHPDSGASSGLSPWLHFGHISPYDVVRALQGVENWNGLPRGERRDGRREGFWGLSENAEAFLDELITWRELGFNACATMPDYDRYDSLPAWARATLEAHEKDPREHVYTLPQLENAETADPVWNAAQRQLLSEGHIHNYLRMLWGKKVLEWTRSPREALEVLIHLNNKYAVDGRDPNSYSGIFWVFGRYDRPWAPERPIFGTIRYMSSTAAQRKLRMRQYMARYQGTQTSLFD